MSILLLWHFNVITLRVHNTYSRKEILVFPYSGKVWQGVANLLFLCIWWKKLWQMNRSANRLSIVTTNLDGFSLVNHRQFAKFDKLSPCQTFLLYGMWVCTRIHRLHLMQCICTVRSYGKLDTLLLSIYYELLILGTSMVLLILNLLYS